MTGQRRILSVTVPNVVQAEGSTTDPRSHPLVGYCILGSNAGRLSLLSGCVMTRWSEPICEGQILNGPRVCSHRADPFQWNCSLKAVTRLTRRSPT